MPYRWEELKVLCGMKYETSVIRKSPLVAASGENCPAFPFRVPSPEMLGCRQCPTASAMPMNLLVFRENSIVGIGTTRDVICSVMRDGIQGRANTSKNDRGLMLRSLYPSEPWFKTQSSA